MTLIAPQIITNEADAKIAVNRIGLRSIEDKAERSALKDYMAKREQRQIVGDGFVARFTTNEKKAFSSMKAFNAVGKNIKAFIGIVDVKASEFKKLVTLKAYNAAVVEIKSYDTLSIGPSNKE